MIYPTTTDLLRNIAATLKDKVEPTVGDVAGLSALATVGHLLNYAQARIKKEGQVLTEEIAAQEPLLRHVQAYLAGLGDAHAADLASALAQLPAIAEGRYPTLDDLAARAGGLREAMHRALARLQALRHVHGEEADYRAIRAAIRASIVQQIEQEGEVVGPAFFGRGPRR